MLDELEKLTAHELADMLANIALLLRRLADVPLNELQADELVAAESEENVGKE
ncbi:MAG TPA: hypothetical protein VL485_24865 [Ktedonobacteraceae bacterium]|jgi:hypothetical protein|nr:hypothetical protein [Ktedonobacteraceae bacterium]